MFPPSRMAETGMIYALRDGELSFTLMRGCYITLVVHIDRTKCAHDVFECLLGPVD